MSSPKPAPAVTTQIQKTELPAWVDNASLENYNYARDISQRPFEPFMGQRVAPMSQGESLAPRYLAEGSNVSNSELDFAQRSAVEAQQRASGYNPRFVGTPQGVNGVTAGSFLGQDIGAYMQPGIDNVVNTTLGGMRQNLARADQTAADQARGAGAWGGSRFGVENAVRAAEGTRQMAGAEAGLRSAAFESAAGRAGTDITTALQAALANQASGLTTQGQRLQAETTNAGLAENATKLATDTQLRSGAMGLEAARAASDIAGRNAVLSQQFGVGERGIMQQGLDAERAAFDEQQSYPTNSLNMRLSALGMSPYGKTTSGTTTATTPTTTNPWMTGIGAAATLLPLMFSDPKIKKNVKKIGKYPGTDLNLHEFEYKGQFNDNKKHVGFMADEVQKKAPGNVVKVNVNGQPVKAVDYGGAIRDSRDDKGKMRGKYKPRLRNFMAA